MLSVLVGGAGVSSGIACKGILEDTLIALGGPLWYMFLSVCLREGEVNRWKVKGVSVSSRSRAEGSLSGVGSSLSSLSSPERSSIGLVCWLQCVRSWYTGIRGLRVGLYWFDSCMGSM